MALLLYGVDSWLGRGLETNLMLLLWQDVVLAFSQHLAFSTSSVRSSKVSCLKIFPVLFPCCMSHSGSCGSFVLPLVFMPLGDWGVSRHETWEMGIWGTTRCFTKQHHASFCGTVFRIVEIRERSGEKGVRP